MPDYSNTSIYHIREGGKVIYVGGTIDFRHRCRFMRLALSTPEHPEHHSLLIKYIREHGGILAFEVVEVHKGNYKDKEEYKQAAQERRTNMKVSLTRSSYVLHLKKRNNDMPNIPLRFMHAIESPSMLAAEN